MCPVLVGYAVHDDFVAGVDGCWGICQAMDGETG